MSWKAVERRIAGVTTKPAAVSLRVLKRDGRAVSLPMLVVSLRLPLSMQLDWQGKDPVSLVIGDGADAGLIRIQHGPDYAIAKVRTLSRGGLAINFGHVPDFGVVEQMKRGCDARIVNRNTVEVVMPDWSKPFDPVADAGTGARAKHLPKPVAAAFERAVKNGALRYPPAPPPSRGSIDGEEDDQGDVPQEEPALPVDDDGAAPEIDANLRDASVERVEQAGMVVIFEPDNEHVVHNGRLVELTVRQAKFMAALVAEYPNDVSLGSVVARMFKRSPLGADAIVAQVYSDLQEPLAEIGLILDRPTSRRFTLRKEEADEEARS